ncbi:hypothetical protein [Sulfurimonas sp.]|uniref:hypothetical protein n=1 Tax=Sulfurimonas sp. TaxID=2022749 RepID=UPI003D0DC810
MNLAFKFKYRFFNAFRELFVHHHGSLEFRAKVFALLIAANEKASIESFIIVKEIGLEIYNHDEDRANLLMLTTREIVQKIENDHSLDVDRLVTNIQQELRIVPRYASKIDIKALKSLTLLSRDEDTIHYQERMLEFLSNLKQEHTEKN